MKKITLTISIYLFLLLISSNTSSAQTDRGSIYVHGLGGDNTQWQQWQALFNQERRMTTTSNLPYTSTNGVANFAAQVPTPANNRTIIFGHSTGGVVARHIERTRANPFGGIITAGSPMDGARVSNNLANGQIAGFITNGLDKVLRGPRRQFGITQGTLFAVTGHFFKDLAERNINLVLNIMQGNATSADLAEGSAYMNNGMRVAASVMPKIHIYGNENSPVLWRIAGIAANEGDGGLVDATQQAYDVCNTFKLVSLAKVITQPWDAIRFAWHADGWAASANWLKDESERGWNDIIGASIPATITTTSQVLDYNQLNQCLSVYAGGQATYEQYMYCQQQSTHAVNYTFYSPVNGQSDGFIKAPSQTGYNSPWSGNATRIEALGVNHLEMRNHPVMGGIYSEIFEGIKGDAFFITPIR